MENNTRTIVIPSHPFTSTSRSLQDCNTSKVRFAIEKRGLLLCRRQGKAKKDVTNPMSDESEPSLPIGVAIFDSPLLPDVV